MKILEFYRKIMEFLNLVVSTIFCHSSPPNSGGKAEGSGMVDHQRAEGSYWHAGREGCWQLQVENRRGPGRWKWRGVVGFIHVKKMSPNYLGKWSNLTSNGLKPPGCWVLMIPLHLCLDQRIREVADSVWHTVFLKTTSWNNLAT